MNFVKKHKDAVVYIATVLISIAFILVGNKLCSTNLGGVVSESRTEVAKVTKISDVILDEFSIGMEDNMVTKTIVFDAEIRSGTDKGKIISVSQTIDGMMVANPKDVEIGDKVVALYETMDGESWVWLFAEYYRVDGILWLCAAFFILLLIFGRKKGMNTIVSLVFTCLAVFAVFVPSVLSGKNIYVMSSIVCLFVIFMTVLIINGANKKTVCAAGGCLLGLAVTGILTVVMDRVLQLTGVVDQEAQFLLLLNENNPIDLRGVIFGAIIIGAMGAIMDVSMSISSALQEVSENMSDRTYAKLLKSGLNIGRDIMGTMANTLILAYIGSSLSIVLLLVANTGSLMNLFNREMIVVEVMQSLVGSLGILFTIPITSLLCASIYHGKKNDIAAAIPVAQTMEPVISKEQEQD